MGIVAGHIHSWNILTSLVGPQISNRFGANTLFATFGIATFIGSVYIYIFVKDTTYVWENQNPGGSKYETLSQSNTTGYSGQPQLMIKRSMTAKEKSEVYFNK